MLRTPAWGRTTPIGLALFLGATFGVACVAPVQQVPAPAVGRAKPLGPALFDPTLIERSFFFANPERARPLISPDGKHLAFLAPKDGVTNVWVANDAAHIDDARPITTATRRGIYQFFWAYTSSHIVYLCDEVGNDNWRVGVVDLASGTARDLTPLDKIQARIVKLSEKKPTQIIVGLNDRTADAHDLYVVDVTTGARTLLEKNERGFTSMGVDDDFAVRIATKPTPAGGFVLMKKSRGAWQALTVVRREDEMTSGPLDFDGTGRTLYWADSTGRNTRALFALDVASGKKTLLAEDARVDFEDVVLHPTKRTLQATSFVWDRKTWRAADKEFGAELATLDRTLGDGEIELLSATLDDQTWTVAHTVDNGPRRFYQWDRRAKKATFLFSNRAAFDKSPLAHMQSHALKSKDGLVLMSTLTLPLNAPDHPLPLVVLVHAGPWSRDVWGQNPWHQWLQSRGYAVLSVNFRGSTGFGKAFVNAGDKQWGKKMQDDLVDAVDWAIAQKIADPARVAIMGASYGGYAVLAGLAYTPEKFACGVDISGPSNLRTFMAAVPSDWTQLLDMLATRVGDPRTSDGLAILDAASPSLSANAIVRPILIAQGAKDPRANAGATERLVESIEAGGHAVTYVLYPDEAHGLARPENRLSFNAVTEIFLAQCLGGRTQPIGADFTGASITVPHGADLIDGLAHALRR